MPVKTVLDGSAVPVRIDVHLGIGATIGSVIATHPAVIPAAVGVDIGCGMGAARMSSGGVFELHQLVHGNGSDGICDSVHVSELDENMVIV